MKLAYRDLGGQGEPVVILHGLFGASQNWVGMGKKLADVGRVFALDMRNHGDSPHGAPHSLAACAGDILEWSADTGHRGLRLVGHSMGGLVAMGFALAHPELVAGVAAVDIAPRPYPPDHARELAALRVDISDCATRADIDARLTTVLPDTRTRQFMMTNAVRDVAGFHWRLDPDVLEASTVTADWATATGRYDGEALLVACGRSPYVRPGDAEVMRRYFPAVRVETLPNADHWPNVTDPAGLEAVLRGFLARAIK
ncbi:MAG TPA: alpha/beta hydrolase [Spirochaetia bacterium]